MTISVCLYTKENSRFTKLINPFKDEAQTALFKAPGRTAL